MFACIFVLDFPVQAALWSEPEAVRDKLKKCPVAILDGAANLLKVVALNSAARMHGMELGMTKQQAGIFGNLTLYKRREADEQNAQAALLDCADAFSPRVESNAPGTVIFDLAGTEKLLGSAERAAVKIKVHVHKLGFDAQIAIAANPDAALLAARGFPGITIIPHRHEAKRLGSLPLQVLSISEELAETLDRWGIHTLKAFGELVPVAVTERLGQEGLELWKIARGETSRPLHPVASPDDFVESFEFDDPVETVESLTFILNRLIQELCERLLDRALATNELRLEFDLEARQIREEQKSERFEHTWKLPFPVQDGRVLLRLVHLELESKTFSAPVKKVSVQVVPVRPRVAQGNLFLPPSPETQQLEITLARIRGFIGSDDAEGLQCVGSPVVLDTHKPDSYLLRRFSSEEVVNAVSPAALPIVAMRRFRPAPETSVELSGEKPYFVSFHKRHLRVLSASGPWRSSGNWWNPSAAWSREEWDVALRTSQGIGYYRIYFDQIGKRWFVEGVFD
ncbi:MAG: DNA polymerase Y family protein [Candidatus Sulfotelmatobacter sp.]